MQFPTEKVFIELKFDPVAAEELAATHDVSDAKSVAMKLITELFEQSLESVWSSVDNALRNDYRVEMVLRIRK